MDATNPDVMHLTSRLSETKKMVLKGVAYDMLRRGVAYDMYYIVLYILCIFWRCERERWGK